MRTPWSALKARQARLGRLEELAEASAMAWAQAYRDEGRPVPAEFDLSDGAGLENVSFLRPGVRPAGAPRARHRRRPSA